MSGGDVACVVVAGGHSRRMGHDKNFVQVDGEALLSRICRACVSVAPTWVVARAGQSLPLLLGAQRLVDESHGELGGPLVGIATGLAHLSSLGVKLALVCASDDVALDAVALRARLEAIEARPEALGVCVESEGRRQPLACVVRVEPALARAREMLRARDARARVWAQDFVAMSPSALGEVHDLDTPDALQSWVEGRQRRD